MTKRLHSIVEVAGMVCLATILLMQLIFSPHFKTVVDRTVTLLDKHAEYETVSKLIPYAPTSIYPMLVLMLQEVESSDEINEFVTITLLEGEEKEAKREKAEIDALERIQFYQSSSFNSNRYLPIKSNVQSYYNLLTSEDIHDEKNFSPFLDSLNDLNAQLGIFRVSAFLTAVIHIINVIWFGQMIIDIIKRFKINRNK